MKIKDLMTEDVEYVDPLASLEEAAQIMSDADVGSVPVVEDGRVVGVITDRDIVVRAVAAGLDPEDAKVGDVMTPEVIHCHPEDDVEDAANLMEEHQIRRIVVTDGDGRLAGMLALADLAGGTEQADEVLKEVSRPAGVPAAAPLASTASEDEVDHVGAGGAGGARAGERVDIGFLIKDELAAAEMYRQALETAGSTPAGEELRRIEGEHEEAARLLQKRMRELGQRPPESSGLWGAFAEAVEGTAKLFGNKAAIRALKEGEEHGVHDYEDALEDDAVPPEIKELISTTLLPRTRAHIPALDRYLRSGV